MEERGWKMRDDCWGNHVSGGNLNHGEVPTYDLHIIKCFGSRSVTQVSFSKPEKWLMWDCLSAGTHRPSLLLFTTCRWQTCAIIFSLFACWSCQDQREEAHFVETGAHHGIMRGVTWDSQIILIPRWFFFSPFLEQKYDNGHVFYLLIKLSIIFPVSWWENSKNKRYWVHRKSRKPAYINICRLSI